MSIGSHRKEMEKMKKRTKGYYKEKWRGIPLHTKVYTGIMIGFTLIGIGAGIWAMYLCGYTLVSWFQQFYGWFILIFGVGLFLWFMWWTIIKNGGVKK